VEPRANGSRGYGTPLGLLCSLLSTNGRCAYRRRKVVCTVLSALRSAHISYLTFTAVGAYA
jgi:hypothetical protein